MSDDHFPNTEMDEGMDGTVSGGDPGQEDSGAISEEEAEPVKAEPKITVQREGETVLERTLDTFPVTFGRKSENDIVLEEKNVSRKHARIVQKENQYFIEDLKSSGGTKLNGEPVEEKDIHTGDVLQIGAYTIHFDSGDPEDDRTVFESDDATVLEEGTVVDEDRTKFYEEPEGRLIIEKSDTLEGEYVLEDETTLGRGDESDIVIEDDRISKTHCKIQLEAEDFILTDLGSSNGTFVNGRKVTEKKLEQGDRIQIGSNVFIFKMSQVSAPVKKGSLRAFVSIAATVIVIGILSFVVTRILTRGGLSGPKDVILQKSWETTASGAIRAPLGLGDLNGDGFINLVALDMSGTVHALDARQGGLVWNSAFQTGAGALSMAPVLADINERDGALDVVIGSPSKGVLTIDGGTRRVIWYGIADKPITTSPAVSDINDDGTADVFVGTAEGQIVCLDGRQGGAVWTFDTGASVLARPVLADLNEDMKRDVLIAAGNMNLYALDGKNGSIIWVYDGTEPMSTVVCSDINRDGRTDVALQTPTELIVLSGDRGVVLWTWEKPASARPTEEDPFRPSPPAVSDLNRDRIPDIVLTTSGGHVYAVDGNSGGSAYLWDYGQSFTRKTAPSLFDFSGDRIADVAVGDADGHVIIIDGKTGYLLNRLDVGGVVETFPVIGDFDGDSKADLVVGTEDGKIIAVRTESRIAKNRIAWNSN